MFGFGVIKAIVTNDTDNEIFSMIRVLALSSFIYFHVMTTVDFYVNNAFDYDSYIKGDAAIIFIYAFCKSLRDLLPFFSGFRLSIAPKPEENSN